jgi:ELWxxDGT repeat protein
MRKAFLLLGSMVIFLAGNSQVFNFIKDCDSTKTLIGSAPDFFTTVGNQVLFSARTATRGFELWKTDGTTNGTVMVRDIKPGAEGSNISLATNYKGKLYFVADDGTHGKELWMSDGTFGGTMLVKDIRPGRYGSDITACIEMNNTLFFVANDGTHGTELWKTDGTPDGTVMVKDINPGPANSGDLLSFGKLNGMILFPANDGVHGKELWKSDGTTTGTVLIKDINPGPQSSISVNDPQQIGSGNGIAYFNATDGISGYMLWKTDGSDAGTLLFHDAITGNTCSSPYNFFFYDQHIFFYASAGAVKIEGGSVVPASISGINGYAIVDGVIYYPRGANFYKASGHNGSPQLVRSFPYNVSGYIAALEGTVFYGATPTTNYNNENEVWKTNVAGTALFKEIYADVNSKPPAILASLNGEGYFIVTDGKGKELWKSNGTAAGTMLIKDIYPGPGSSSPQGLVSLNGAIYFSAISAPNVRELWRTDGTETGTIRLQDFQPWAGLNIRKLIGSYNGNIYFIANQGMTPEKLYKSDGTAAGTVAIKEVPQAFTTSLTGESFLLNGQLYFRAGSSISNPNTLWKTDGTPDGTEIIMSGLATPKDFYNANGTVFFTTGFETTGQNLWKTDGTAAGTVLLKSVHVTAEDTRPFKYFTYVNGLLFFVAESGNIGWELWRSDGTEAGTFLVKDIYAGREASNPIYLAGLNGVLYFQANDGINGKELWRSDGTAAGTVLMKDFLPGLASGEPQSMINYNGNLYFHAVDEIYGRELLKIDGTGAIALVKDINPGGGNGINGELFIIQNRLYFSGNDGINGEEIWKSNGDAGETMMVYSIIPASGGSMPQAMTEVNGTIFLAATTDDIGPELYAAIGLQSPLPLAWLEFTGRNQNNEALLTWKTENEINTERFIVERSINRTDYSAIGSLTALNNSGLNQYNFMDAQMRSLGSDVVYYRLKQFDHDGKYSYSKIIALSLKGKNLLLLYPNPVADKANLSIAVNKADLIHIRVVDNMGHVVKEQQLQIGQGSTTLSISLDNLAKGMYYLEVVGETINERKQFLKL